MDPLPDPWVSKASRTTARTPICVARSPDAVFLTKPLEILGPRSLIRAQDKLLFDDEVGTTPDSQIIGSRNGLAWVRKVENHLICRAPIFLAIL